MPRKRFFACSYTILAAAATAATVIAASFCLLFPLPAYAASGYASVGASWMEGTQSYFEVNVLGQRATGACYDHGAAEPFPGFYPFTADASDTRIEGVPFMWLEGSKGVSTINTTTGLSYSQIITFRSDSAESTWTVPVPAGCQMHTFTNDVWEAGTSVVIHRNQTFYFTTNDPDNTGGASGETVGGGTVRTPATASTSYWNIIITPPDAWDGVTYVNGLPSGYQRVKIDYLATKVPTTAEYWFGFSIKWLAPVRYFVDGESKPCFIEGAKRGELYAAPPFVATMAEKPHCTPGIDAWYSDRLYRNPYEAAPITGALDLFGRNRATISYAHSWASLVWEGMPLYQLADAATKPVASTDILPPSTIADWGTVTRLKKPRFEVLYYYEPERWRTMRRTDGGWHLLYGASDSPLATLRVERDTSVYDNWTRSTYDGVQGW
ncbi:MAG: hypothetical protein RR917_01185 [Eggerthellaceae bacterium]